MDTIGEQPKDEKDAKPNPIIPSAETATIRESTLSRDQENKPDERWNSLRQWISHRLEDEKATPMPRLPTPKKQPLHSIHELSPDELASFRARRISVTLQKTSRDSKWGFSLQQQQQQQQQHASETMAVQIKRMAKQRGTLLEYAPFQPGDILVSINGQPSTDAPTTIQQLVEMESHYPITLLVETPQGDPNSVQVVVLKPTVSTLGLEFCNYLGQGKEKGTSSSKANKNNPPGIHGDTQPLQEYKELENLSTCRGNVNNLLRIQCIEPHGILAHSPLCQGDIVMAINATPCSQMTPHEANALLHQSNESVTIIAIKPSPSRQQQWLRHARRAGVAIGGGTMVGIGLIFIPTLPPPFGEALLVGGVSVLGTEFETPKRIMKSARDSFELVVGSDDEDPSIMEDNDAVDAKNNTELASNHNDETGNKSRSIKGRVKTFGRRHVLPLLNQAVGDRQQNKNDNG